jgi:pyrroloquinoline quinone biosynthesis protein D
MKTAVTETVVPRFPPGVKFRFDSVRNAWVLLAPERLFVPDEQAVEILKLVDGVRKISEIVDILAARFGDTPRDVIATDVSAMLHELAAKGALRL